MQAINKCNDAEARGRQVMPRSAESQKPKLILKNEYLVVVGLGINDIKPKLVIKAGRVREVETKPSKIYSRSISILSFVRNSVLVVHLHVPAGKSDSRIMVASLTNRPP